MARLERREIDSISVIVPLDEPYYALVFLAAAVASVVCYVLTKF